MITNEQEDELISLLLILLKRKAERQAASIPVLRAGRHIYDKLEIAGKDGDLAAARAIAGEKSKQTGKNLRHFLSGDYDHAFGVQCALAGINHGRKG